jgi:hypothetical protein
VRIAGGVEARLGAHERTTAAGARLRSDRVWRAARAARLWLALVLPVLGCEGIGLPVVGTRGPGAGQVFMCPVQGPVCESDPGTAAPLTPPLNPQLDLDACGGVTAQCGEVGRVDRCTLRSTLRQDEARGHGFLCARAEFTVAPDATLVRFRELSLERAELVISSDHPVTVEIERALSLASRIELRGPITLRFLANGRLSETRVFESVQLDVPGAAAQRGAALELIESSASKLVVGELRDRIAVIRSRLDQTQLFADDVLLDTSSVDSVTVVARELYAVQVQGRALSLQAARSAMSELTLAKLDVQRCESMLIAGSRVAGSSFGACLDRLRIDRSLVSDTVIAGNVEGNLVTWNTTTFGVGPGPAAVEIWGGSMVNNRLCGATTRVALADVTTYLCNICDQLGPPAEQNLCVAMDVLGEPTSNPGNPFCPALDNLPALLECAPPVLNENPF